HDFNNTLAGILGAVSLLKADIESGIHRDISDLSGEIDIIERSAKRAASSVNRLLALTRKRSPENVAFRLDEAVDRVVQFARRSLDQSVAISLAEDMPIATVSGDAGQLEQLILNLVINAGHAMTVMRPVGHKPGGTIEVRLQSFHPDRAYLLANPAVEDRDYWVLSIRDEGVGIPRHLQNRIFDPFYTTKPGDVSSGLGLTMVHAIARQHRGFVELNSELGKGTEFFVYLPKASVEVACARQEPLGGVGQGLVLVADDDDIPRETIASMVEALGYTAVTASGGEEVLRMFSENPDDWKLAVLDFRMGDMDGDHVARTMRSIRQDLPVVLASGFHGDASDSAYGFETSFATLQKPFTLHELGKAIESVLARQR
ncbi:MAG: response regulator, partial [Spirochaetales bacterium]|nr:response regulator [Spirochaetales bacterium]